MIKGLAEENIPQLAPKKQKTTKTEGNEDGGIEDDEKEVSEDSDGEIMESDLKDFQDDDIGDVATEQPKPNANAALSTDGKSIKSLLKNHEDDGVQSEEDLFASSSDDDDDVKPEAQESETTEKPENEEIVIKSSIMLPTDGITDEDFRKVFLIHGKITIKKLLANFKEKINPENKQRFLQMAKRMCITHVIKENNEDVKYLTLKNEFKINK